MGRKASAAILAALALLLAAGLALVIRNEVDRGRQFARHSTLSGGRDGTKALFEAFRRLPGVEAVRHYRGFDRLGGGGNTALFYLGDTSGDAPTDNATAEKIAKFLESGGRLILACTGPAEAQTVWDDPSDEEVEAKKEDAPEDTRKKAAKHKEPAALPHAVDLASLWGFGIRTDGKGSCGLRREAGLPRLPADIPGTENIRFTAQKPQWRVVYGTPGAAAVMERPWGRGSIVLTITGYMENQELAKNRRAELLAWLAGGRRRLLFEESHLGNAEEVGVSTLVREYGLQGLAAAGLLVAALFLWRRLSRLLPPHEEAEEKAYASQGRDATAAFRNLLRRSVTPGRLPAVCLEQWLRSAPEAKRRRLAPLIAEAQAIAAASGDERAATETYNRICEALNPDSGRRRTTGSANTPAESSTATASTTTS